MFFIGEPVRKVLASICHIPRTTIIYQELSEESDPSDHLRSYSPSGNGHRKHLFRKYSTVVLRVEVLMQLSAEGWCTCLCLCSWVRLIGCNGLGDVPVSLVLQKVHRASLWILRAHQKWFTMLPAWNVFFFFLREFKCRRTQDIAAIECFITI